MPPPRSPGAVRSSTVLALIGLSLASTVCAQGAEPSTAPSSADLPAPVLDDADSAWSVPGYLRLDADVAGLQLWVGASHDLGPVDFVSDVYLDGSVARLDVGIALAVGPLAVLPMVGMALDFATQQLATLAAPQLFTVFELGPIYLEQWTQLLLNSPAGYGAGDDRLYLRQFILYGLGPYLALGPQVEVDFALNARAGKGVVSVPVGGRLNLAYGSRNTLGVFLGYETLVDARRAGPLADTADGVRGRFTFIRAW